MPTPPQAARAADPDGAIHELRLLATEGSGLAGPAAAEAGRAFIETVDRMARAGVDPATAAKITGHSIQVMLQQYRTVTPEDMRSAIAVAGLGSLEASPRVVPFRRKEGQ